MAIQTYLPVEFVINVFMALRSLCPASATNRNNIVAKMTQAGALDCYKPRISDISLHSTQHTAVVIVKLRYR